MTDVIPPSSAWESSKEVVESESECELEAHDGVTTIVSDDDAGSLRVLLQSPSPSCALDGDDIVAELVGDLVEESMIRSVETFYQQRLTGFASRWIADSMLEVVLSTLGVPSAACERDGASHPANDPILSVLYPPPSALYEPQRSRIDLCCRHEIPLKPPERKPSHETMMSPPNHSIYNKRLHRGPASNCGGRKDSSSRASSHSPLRVQKATIPPESSVASSSSSAVSTLDSKDLGNGEYHAPGVVYSTAPPPRVSPRKAMALLKTAQHMSGVGAAPPSPLIYPPKESDDEATGDVSSEVKQPDGADALSDASCSLSPHAKQSIHPRRRLRGAVGDAMSKGDPFVEEITPIEVEFVVKRSSSGDKRDRRSNGSLLQLPELSPHKQRRRPRQTTFVAGDDSEHSLHQHRDGVITVGDGSASTDDSRFSGDDNDRCCGDLWSSQSHIESMVLAPGVKLQAGVETKAGPALPFVPTRMRKATFYQDDALTLAASMQSLHSSLSHSSKNVHASSHQQQCPAPGKKTNEQASGCATSSSSSITSTNSSRGDFRELAKQRAFIRKPSFVTSPSKKVTLREKDHHRRPATTTGAPPPTSRTYLDPSLQSGVSTASLELTVCLVVTMVHLSPALTRRSLQVQKNANPLANAVNIM